jgi:hypothetical protein
VTKSDLNPQPRAWPCCALCHMPFVLRRSIVFSAVKSAPKRHTLTMEWCWQRDCKHRKSGVESAGSKRSEAGAK